MAGEVEERVIKVRLKRIDVGEVTGQAGEMRRVCCGRNRFPEAGTAVSSLGWREPEMVRRAQPN